MNPNTGEVALEPAIGAVVMGVAAARSRRAATGVERFEWRDVSREEIESAYIEAHNGARRPAVRRMARDLAKNRCARDVIGILRVRREAVSA